MSEERILSREKLLLKLGVIGGMREVSAEMMLNISAIGMHDEAQRIRLEEAEALAEQRGALLGRIAALGDDEHPESPEMNCHVCLMSEIARQTPADQPNSDTFAEDWNSEADRAYDQPKGSQVVACAKCGHSGSLHGKEQSFYETDSNRSVCLECNGWYEDSYPRDVRKPALHVFKRSVKHDRV